MNDDPSSVEEAAIAFLRCADDASRQAVIGQFLSYTAQQPKQMGVVSLAMRLRDQGALIWAELLFTAALAIPEQRLVARYEMAVLFSLQGRLSRAIEIFDEMHEFSTSSPEQKLFVARQYARFGQFAVAKQLLENAIIEDPRLHREGLAEMEFCRYLRLFPVETAIEAHETEAAQCEMLPSSAVIRRIEDALRNQQPASVIRLGDGEGIYLQISLSDEAEFGHLYARGRAEFHRIWYSDMDLLQNPEFMVEMFRVQTAYENADCLSIINHAGIRKEYAIGSPRGVPAMNNFTRFLRLVREKGSAPKTVCAANISRDMLLSGELSGLIHGRAFLGLVSCYAALPERLSNAFGIARVELIQTYGESAARLSGGEGPEDKPGEAFLKNHLAVCAAFDRVKPGELYLVAAGIFGKIYCDLIKRQGGIALDIGSVADIWMGVSTRTFSVDEQRLVLPA